MNENLKTKTATDDEGDKPTKPSSPKGVQVLYGAVADNFDLAGSTAKEALDTLAGVLNIPKDGSVQVVLNGETVNLNNKKVLQEGDILEFTRRMGEKGMETEGEPMRTVLVLLSRAMVAVCLGFGVAFILTKFLL